MESLSSKSLLEEQKITVQNKFILRICEQYHQEKDDFRGFKDSIINKFRLFLLSKNIILTKSSNALISKKIKYLHSRLVAPTDSIEYEQITNWHIDSKISGKEIKEDKKIYCQYFKDWFISGNISL